MRIRKRVSVDFRILFSSDTRAVCGRRRKEKGLILDSMGGMQPCLLTVDLLKSLYILTFSLHKHKYTITINPGVYCSYTPCPHKSFSQRRSVDRKTSRLSRIM